MNKYKNIYEIIDIIINSGVNIEFEDRIKKGYKTYKTFNHAEILNYYNSADNMFWDAQVFGYNYKFKFNKIYKTKKILGIIWIPNGNHKIILKLNNKGFSKIRFNKQLNTYIKNYTKLNKINTKLFLFDD